MGNAGVLQRQPATTLNLPQNPALYSYALVNAFPPLEFTRPLVVVTPPGENNRLFVVEQPGRIVLINDLRNPTRTVFLDISDRVLFNEDDAEGGILGLAFHPDYAKNGFIYVYYVCNTVSQDGSGRHDRLARFTRSRDGTRADANTEQILFTQYDEEFNHNGGALLFGPDGYLYLTLGDEGYPKDIYDNAQRIDKDFFSGVFRMDVDRKPLSLDPNPHPALGGRTNYWIPRDNPFVGARNFNGRPVDAAKVRTEFYAVGIRSPWRMFWDVPTGNVYFSEVGETGDNPGNRSEEINLLTKAGNYGWPYREGNQPGPKADQTPAGFSAIEPLISYERGNSGPFVGRAAIGGVVYRGPNIPELSGAYIFGDYFSGNVWALRHSGNSVTEWRFLMAESQGHIVSFGTDPRNGDVLVCDIIDQQVKRLIPVPSADRPPDTLSGTGVFADVGSLTPNPGVVPYDVNVPFWSDGATKRRWFAIPDANAQITSGANGTLDYPDGTVFIKHFDLNGQRVETRLLVKVPNRVYGLTYAWNGNDAFLVPSEGMDRNFGGQRWHFPGRNECGSCHTPVAGHVLGFKAEQLNRTFDYPNGPENQLRALSEAGYLRGGGSGKQKLVALDDTRASLEARVKSYLAANCAQCHQPGGPARSSWDARLSTPMNKAGIVSGPLLDHFGVPANRVIAPQSPDHSVLLQRIATTDPRLRMPPLASSVVDQEAVALVTQWINTLPVRNQPLSVRVTAPKGSRAANEVITLRGTATGTTLDQVVVSVNGGPEQMATGALRWSAEVTLQPGVNTILVYAVDANGNRSRAARRLLSYRP